MIRNKIRKQTEADPKTNQQILTNDTGAIRQNVLTINREFPAFDASFDSLEKQTIKQITTFKLDDVKS